MVIRIGRWRHNCAGRSLLLSSKRARNVNLDTVISGIHITGLTGISKLGVALYRCPGKVGPFEGYKGARSLLTLLPCRLLC
jgi:hypothetical protein